MSHYFRSIIPPGMHLHSLLRCSVLASILGLGGNACAQLPTVDITMVTNMDQQLEVKLRPTGPFNGVVGGLVFTIRWNADDGVSLGEPEQVAPHSQYIPIAKSDVEQDQDGYRYQIFAGFGFTSLSNVGFAWEGDTEYTVMTIAPLAGESTFALVNDAFTQASNGDFFISLNGNQTTTGEIYGGNTGIHAAAPGHFTAHLMPNPARGSSVLHLHMASSNPVRLAMMDASGRTVWEREQGMLEGENRLDLPLAGLAPGIYLLRVAAGGTERTLRLVCEGSGR